MDNKTMARLLAAAHAAHEANRAYCLLMGDDSQVPWDLAPGWQKNSAVDGAKAIFENPATTPEQSHEGWMKVKLADGWVYGETKDADAKAHPCLVEYWLLPKAQRMKDHIFGAVVRAMIENTDRA